LILHKRLIICNHTNSNRKTLLELSKDEKLSEKVEIIYIYSIKNKTINYPLRDGQILYIGEACREKEATGKRFSQHISAEKNKGADNGSNYTLSMYYWNNNEIVLNIYIMEDKENRKDLESILLKLHMKKHGSLPIAQGSTGENYTIKSINNITEKYHELI